MNDGSILEMKGRRNSTGKRGEAEKNPNPDKHGPKRAYGKPGYVTDEGRDGQRGCPRPARPENLAMEREDRALRPVTPFGVQPS